MAEDVKYENRQGKVWCPILYPVDNKSHEAAISIIESMPGTILMDHDELIDPETGEPKNKRHTHCIIRFPNGTWLSTLLNKLGLSNDDAHLFKMFSELHKEGSKAKFKSVNDYIIYLTHIKEEDKDEHNPIEFYGTDRDHAIEVCSNIDKTPYDMFDDMMVVYNDLITSIPETHLWKIHQFYFFFKERGYGRTFWANWPKMMNLIKDHISYF